MRPGRLDGPVAAKGSQTLLQPIHFFVRAWPLCLLRQMGYDILTPEEIGPIDELPAADPA